MYDIPPFIECSGSSIAIGVATAILHPQQPASAVLTVCLITLWMILMNQLERGNSMNETER